MCTFVATSLIISMKNFKRTLLGCILLLQAMLLHSSQFESFYWGYGANQYTSITQDDTGLIWLGTNSGLFCYNDYQFYPIVQGIHVHSVLVINDDLICFTSETGIHFYKISTGQLTTNPYKGMELGRVRTASYIDKKIWFGTEKQGLITYDIDKTIWAVEDEHIGECYTMSYDQKDRLYIGGIEGLGYYSISTNTYTSVDRQSFVNSCLWDTQDACLWIGTDNSLLRYNPQSTKMQSVLTSDTNFKCIVRKENHLLIGTDNGLIQYNPQTNQKTVYSHDISDSKSICHNAVWSLYNDKDKNIWIGTSHGVSLMQHAPYYTFISLSSITKDLQVANNQGNHFSNILKDSQGRYWLGGDDGIILQDKETKIWFQKESISHHIPHNIIRRIYEDKDGEIWLATDNGVLRYLPKKKQFVAHKIVSLNGKAKAEWVYDLYEDIKGRLWIATYGGGLFVADKQALIEHGQKTYRCAQIGDIDRGDVADLPNHVYYIKEDKHHNLWLGHRNGLSMLQIETLSLQTIPVLDATGKVSHFNIQNLTFDDDEHLWYTTKNCLGRLNVESRQVDLFPQESLKNNVVSSMVYHNKLFWITTTEGIKVYNPQTNICKDLNIPDDEYRSIYYDAAEERFILGGYNALLRLDPSIYTAKEAKRPIHIVSIVHNNKRLKAHIEYQLKDDDRLASFPASINQLTFEISDFSYSKKKPYSYEYQLYRENQQAAWNKLPVGDNHIVFHELSPNKYTLKLRSSLRKEEISSFPFEIRPPWYLSLWAKVIYVIIVMITLGLFISYLFTRNKRKYERMEKEKSLELSKMKIDFFTNISHDLNTPLSLIIAPLEKILSEVHDTLLRSQLEGVHKNALRLNKLIQRILDFNRSSYKEEETLMRSRIEMNRLLNTVLSSFNQTAKDRGITLHITPCDEEVWLNLDLFKMESIFYNLVSNAVKFVDNETGRINVTLSKNDNNNQLVVTVQDNGRGIPQDEHKMVWLRLYQGKNKNNTSQGTGIGLYLVKKFVSMHGGTVSLESAPKQGSTFMVKLPLSGDNLTVTSTQAIDAKTSEDQKEHTSDIASRPKLLIVDDNQELLDFMQSVFSDTYQCHLAQNGQEGLEKAQSVRPDIMLIDEMMPIMTGLELCKQVRKTAYLASTPIIMLTAKTDHDTELQSLKAGVDVFMHKSFELAHLKLRIQQLLESRKLVVNKMQKDKLVESTIEVKEEILNSDEKIMKRVLQVIEERMSNPDFNVSMLCEETGIGSKKMLRLIKQQTGMTPVNFIRQLRLKKTAVLLEQNRFTISEVMHMVGFSHPSYFAKSFTKEFGVSPKEYMEKYSE